MVESFPMPNPESRVYYYQPEDKIFGPESLRQAYPCWSEQKITGQDVVRIRSMADFEGVLTQNRAREWLNGQLPNTAYEIKGKDGDHYETLFEVTPNIVGHIEALVDEALHVANAAEIRAGRAPLVGVLRR